uniref:Uncharacterized protein n=1 Tax=Lactuca sativa TaxID=4236 RepID=A0A9R1WNQ3_LACSA|nr:hypothetical protein LSAT_V11C900455380 [Lactuca sativa]
MRLQLFKSPKPYPFSLFTRLFTHVQRLQQEALGPPPSPTFSLLIVNQFSGSFIKFLPSSTHNRGWFRGFFHLYTNDGGARERVYGVQLMLFKYVIYHPHPANPIPIHLTPTRSDLTHLLIPTGTDQKYVGVDITSMVTLPVLIFEPMTMLPKMEELMEYAHLLEQADNYIIEDLYSPRTAAMDFVSELVRKHGKEKLQKFILFIVEIFKRAGADDKPLWMVKTVLHELVKLRGTVINGHLSMVPIDMEPQPIILAYIDLNLQTLAAARMLTPAGPVDLE